MKKTFALLFASILFTISQKSIAQSSISSPILTVNQFIQLLGASTDRAEDILPSSFVRIESGSGKTKSGNDFTFTRYKRDYKGSTYQTNRSLLDYDVFSIRNDKVVEFTTTDPTVYKKYKESFKKYGFKWVNDKDGISGYAYSTYFMYIHTDKNVDGNIVYGISLIP